MLLNRLLLLLPISVSGGIGWYIASTVTAGIGYGISFSVVADIAVTAVPTERASSAAAIAETSNELGNALGIALLGSLAALIFRLQGPDLAGTLTETIQVPDLSGYHHDYLDYVAMQLNNRPRKRLDWRTPAERLDQLLSQQDFQTGVALTG
jgi:site-specific recombinase